MGASGRSPTASTAGKQVLGTTALPQAGPEGGFRGKGWARLWKEVSQGAGDPLLAESLEGLHSRTPSLTRSKLPHGFPSLTEPNPVPQLSSERHGNTRT